MRTISVQQRRHTLVRRHCLGGGREPGGRDRQGVRFALHATDPASVYLSVLARSAASTLADVSEARYEHRSLVRWMAMRRTLFRLRVRAECGVHDFGHRSGRCWYRPRVCRPVHFY